MKSDNLFVIILLTLMMAMMAACQADLPDPTARAATTTPTTIEKTVPSAPTDTAVLPTAGTKPAEEIFSYPMITERQCELFVPAGDVFGETIQCGYVIVPADRANPESKEIQLAYVILKATGNNPQPDPIIHVSGGPGLSATTRSTIVELALRYTPMRERRDIILYDQRGVGHSQPTFECTDFIKDADAVQSTFDSYNACQEGLRKAGYPAETFTTAVSATDLLDVMKALEYPSYNLYGISYGSRLLMSFIHHYPDEALVRSIILDSVDTLPEDLGTEYRTATHLLQKDLFESVFNACTEDPACAEVYPDLRSRFDVLAGQLNETPLILDEFTTIDGDTLFQYFFPYNFAVQNIPFQPRLITELEQGITTTLDLIRLGQIPEPETRTTFLPPEPPVVGDLLDLYLNCDDGSASDEVGQMTQMRSLWDAEPEIVAAFLNQSCDPETAAAAIEITDQNPSVFNHIISRFVPDDVQGLTPGINSKLNCTEQYPFHEDFSEIEANLQEAQLPDFYIEKTISEMLSTAEGCDAWQDALTAPTPQIYGGYPVLVLQGQFDSLTPPAWAETAVSAIPKAEYVLVPNAWHSIMGNNGPCPTNITQQFLTNPDADIDTACTEGMKVQFLLPLE